MDVPYLTGSEPPTAALVKKLFTAFDAKLTTLLGGRSFFLAQTTPPPSYLLGRPFFFTAGTAVYAKRVPGWVDGGSGSVKAYDHSQFDTAQKHLVLQPGHVKGATLVDGGDGYQLNDAVNVPGGVLAPGGSPAQVQVTLAGAGGNMITFTLTNPGSYLVLPPSPALLPPRAGHQGATLNLDLFQYDPVNKVAPVVSTAWNASQLYVVGQGVVDWDNQTILPDCHYYVALAQNTNKRPLANPAQWQKLFAVPALSGTPTESVYSTGFFEASLAAHSLLHQDTVDKKPVRYYVQDGATTPEKHLSLALAEIIIEGVPAVTIEKAWDKYGCFRIHNLQGKPATLKFADSGYVVNLTPYQCLTVRRDLRKTPAMDGSLYENYRAGYNYFFPFEGGDPRFYWFLPTQQALFSAHSHALPAIGSFDANPRAANSMRANNLSNVALLFDWMQYFQRKPDNTTTFAGWNEDPTVQVDIYSAFYKKPNVALFGDPSDPKTLVGDLLHHKGDILILRLSIKKRDPASGNPVITNDTVTFNGYASIAADFAKKKLLVAENADGNLCVRNGDPDNHVLLVPVGTNLFKVADNLDSKLSGLGGGWFPDSNSFTFNLTTFNGSGIGLPYVGSTNVLTSASGNDTFVVIEQAVFEPVPETPWVDWDESAQGHPLLLTNTAPGMIQQPIATVATDQRAWFDLYNNLAEVDVLGVPQTTLNWNTTAHGLLTVPTILDGGSGYAVDDEEQLVGGTGDPAVVTITAVNGGKALAIKISYPGNYTSPPPSPNLPVQIYPTDRQGSGLRLGGINIPFKTLNVQKATVADLLTLDYWGDPRNPGQTSQYVVISDRKLMLTPHGLILQFTETDSPLAGDSGGQPASLPTWASGKRGLPRKRAFRFRGHGWGYVGGQADTEIGSNPTEGTATLNTSPSEKSGWLSPRVGRFEMVGGYKGEVVAPDGRDFSIKTQSRQGIIKLLSRVRAASLALLDPLGRFWQALKLDAVANILAQRSPPSFFQRWLFLLNAGSYPAIPVRLALLPEMYNALARAVNALTTGTPLSWQCLFFNVGGISYGSLLPGAVFGSPPGNISGIIVNLDPKCPFTVPWPVDHNGTPITINGLPPAPGQVALTGTSGGSILPFYIGPRPMNQFGAFDQGTVYQALCNQLGIPVRTENDLPGGTDEFSKSAALSYFAGKYCTPAVYGDSITANSLGFISMDTELLANAKILKGLATGSNCLGTYDPAQFNNVPLFPGGPLAATEYPDFHNATQGQYYIAGDGSGMVAVALGNSYTDVGGNRGCSFEQRYLFGGPLVPGKANWPGGVLDLVTAFVAYRWVQVEDIQRAVVQNGFPFLWDELCTPLALKYFEDLTKIDILAASYTGSFTMTSNLLPGGPDPVDGQPWGFLGINLIKNRDGSNYYNGNVTNHLFPTYNQGTNNFVEYVGNPAIPTYKWNITPAPADFLTKYLNGQEVKNALLSLGANHPGTLVKFCPASDPAKALWKCAPPPAPTTAAVDGPVNSASYFTGYGYPAEILTLKSRKDLSPFFRWIGFGKADGNFDYEGGFTVSLTCGMDAGIGVSGGDLASGQRPSTVGKPQIAAQYVANGLSDADFSDLLSISYAEGSLLDQRQIFAFNIYSSHPIAKIPVLLVGQQAWEKTKDSWGGLDSAYAAVGTGAYRQDYIPWSYVPPAPVLVKYVTDYFGGTATGGLTIIAPPADDERYWCCFDAALFDLTQVTF